MKYVAIVPLLLMLGCGGGRPTPISPTPQPTPPVPSPPGTFTLSGTVTAAPLNETLADARVEALHAGQIVGNATTDRAGVFSMPGLPPQDYVIRATKTGYNVRDREVQMAADVRLDIVMDRNRVIVRGSVSDAPPCVLGIDGARVEIVDGPDAGKAAMTGGTGEYQLDGIAWGTFRIRASKTGYASVEETLTIPPRPDPSQFPLSQHFRLQSQAGRYLLQGVVRNIMIETAPWLNGVLVEVTGGPNAGRSTTTGTSGLGNGRYEFSAMIPGTAAFRMSKAGFITEEGANLVVCGDTRNDVPLTPVDATLRGLIRDESAAPLDGAVVRVTSGVPAGKSAVANAAGEYAIVGIYGTFSVEVTHPGYTSELRLMHTGPFLAGNFVLRRAP